MNPLLNEHDQVTQGYNRGLFNVTTTNHTHNQKCTITPKPFNGNGVAIERVCNTSTLREPIQVCHGTRIRSSFQVVDCSDPLMYLML